MTSPYLNNWSDEDPEEPVEPLGPAARRLAFERMCATGDYSPEADPLRQPPYPEDTEPEFNGERWMAEVEANSRARGFDPTTNSARKTS